MANKKAKDTVRAFVWKSSNRERKLLVLDQLLLPHKEAWIPCTKHAQVADCIRKMQVRGAPAIGCVAAFGLVLAAWEKNFSKLSEMLGYIYACSQTLVSTRPTAVNLFWAIERMKCAARRALHLPKTDREKIKKLREFLESEAIAIYDEDLAGNYKMGEYGSKLFPEDAVILTHCNTGSLATSGWGTALGVIRTAFSRGKIKKVLASETRPYLQGARLTAWELMQDDIPFELITDNMAAHILKTEKVHAVIVGADRIAANGDTANKIGTYALAVLCHYHRVPFYVAAPTSTIDMQIATGAQIPIEERSSREVTRIKNCEIAPADTQARHPAFDVTPHPLIRAIITEKGVVSPPNREKMADLMEDLTKKVLASAQY